MKIEDFFRKMEKCHKKRKIEEAFNEEKSLNDILKRERMKCLEKVKKPLQEMEQVLGAATW